jgi:hypothetical protein
VATPPRPSDDPLLDLTPAPPVRASDLQSTDDLLNSLDLEVGLDEVDETIEELEVLPDDAPDTVAVPYPPDRPGRTTLVKDADESEEMRRKIGRPAQPAVEMLDELGVDPSPAAKSRSFTGLGSPPAASASAVAAPRPAGQAAPVSIPVEITAPRGEHELSVPIEVTVGRPGTPTHVRLHIDLTIKLV